MDVARPAETHQFVTAQIHRTLRATLLTVLGISLFASTWSGIDWYYTGDMGSLLRFCDTCFLGVCCSLLFAGSFLTQRTLPIVTGLVVSCSIVLTSGLLNTGSLFILGIGVTLPIAGAIFLPERKWVILIASAHVLLTSAACALIQYEWWVPPITSESSKIVYFGFISALVTGCSVGLITWLHELSKKFVSIVGNSCDGLLYSDENGVVQKAVGPLFEELRLSNETWVGKHHDEIFECQKNQLDNYAGNNRSVEAKIVGQRWVRATRTVDGQAGGHITTLKDIDGEVIARHQLNEIARMESLAQVCGGLAHDFNNLLTVIGIYSEMIESTPVRERIIEAQQKACELTNGLLTFARQGSSDAEIVDLVQYVDSLRPVIESLAPVNIEVDMRLGSGPLPVEIDVSQLQQIIINLINNAVDAMRSGGQLMVSIEETELKETAAAAMTLFPGDFACLTVRDNGVGMSSEVQSRALEPFFTTKPRGEGTGIGLSTLHGTVTKAGGAVEVESELGIGTCIKIWLPCSSASVARSPAVAQTKQPSVVSRLRVLLIEDRQEVRMAMKLALEAEGMEVQEFASAEPAWDTIQREPPDVVISDIVLPGMSGIELFKQIRQQHQDLNVLLMSGYHQEDLSLIIEDDPHAAFVQKPFKITGLFTIIQKLTSENSINSVDRIAN